MGFRFRRSVKVGPGIRLNLGSKSVGLSAGVRGLRISSNTRTGTRVTVGIPGTGLSYSQKVDLNALDEPEPQPGGQRIFDAYGVPLYDELLKKSKLDLRDRHSVLVKGKIINWFWLCPCCGALLPDPLIGSKEFRDTGIFETKMYAHAVNMRHCDSCNKHLQLSLEALSHVPGSAGPAVGSFVIGCVLSPVIWIISMVIFGPLADSYPLAFVMSMVFALCPIAWGMSQSQKAEEKAKQEAQYAENRANRYYREAREAMTPDCSCCYLPAVIVEQQGSERIFHFAHEKCAMAFAKINENNVLAWNQPAGFGENN